MAKTTQQKRKEGNIGDNKGDIVLLKLKRAAFDKC